MKFNKNDYFVLEYKYFDEIPVGGRYLIVEKNSFSIGNGFYSIDDEYLEIKGKKAKKLLEIAEKFDNTKECDIIDNYKAIKIKEAQDVLLYLTETN